MANDVAEFKKTHTFNYYQKQSDFSTWKILENYFIFDDIRIFNGKKPSSNDSYTLDNASKLFTLLNVDKTTVYKFTIRDNLTEDITKEGFIFSEYDHYDATSYYSRIINGEEYCSMSYDYEYGIVQKNDMHLHCGNIGKYEDIFIRYPNYGKIDPVNITRHHSVIIDDIEYYSSHAFEDGYLGDKNSLLHANQFNSTRDSDPFFNATNNTTMEISLYVD